jgi:hypothetical protein
MCSFLEFLWSLHVRGSFLPGWAAANFKVWQAYGYFESLMNKETLRLLLDKHSNFFPQQP